MHSPPVRVYNASHLVQVPRPVALEQLTQFFCVFAVSPQVFMHSAGAAFDK